MGVWKSRKVADLSLRLDNQNNVLDYAVADVSIDRWEEASTDGEEASTDGEEYGWIEMSEITVVKKY